jgi:RNA polymerase sigma-70 factor (ECF subfamily)
MQNVNIFSVQNLAADEKDENEILSLRQALDRLSNEEKEIVILHYCSGYSSKEIGEIMGIKDSTVRSKLMRSGKKLRTYLQI